MSEETLNDFTMDNFDDPGEDKKEEQSVEDQSQDQDQKDDVQEDQADETQAQTEDITPSIEDEFKQLGLDRQFPGGVRDMLHRVPAMNKWQTDMSQENAELNRRMDELSKQQKDDEGYYDPDAFIADPQSVLDKRYMTREESQQLLGKIEKTQMELANTKLQSFASSRPDFDKVYPVMEQMFDEDPGVVHLKDPLGYLYKQARDRMGLNSQEKVEKAKLAAQKKIDQESTRAETTGGGRKAPPAPANRRLTRAELYNLPLEDLKKRCGGYGPE